MNIKKSNATKNIRHEIFHIKHLSDIKPGFVY